MSDTKENIAVSERNAETIAANLDAWATWIRNYTLTMRVGTGKLHEAPDHLRDAALWIREHYVDNEICAVLPPPGAVRCSMGMDKPPSGLEN